MDILPHIVNGLTLGLLFALIALGFMLIVSVMEVINLAHGSLFALGAYIALEVLEPRWLGDLEGLRLLAACIAAFVVVYIVGMGLELCVRRTYGKKAEYGLLLTFGAGLVIEETIRLIWGPGEQSLALPSSFMGAFMAGDLIYSKYRFIASGAAILLIGFVWTFLERTPYGAMVKAGAHDNEMVRALGINISRLRILVFGLGSALAGLAGVVLTPIWGLRPHVGIDVVIPAFLIIVLGGIGSFWGAVLAGLLVGVTVGITGAYASEWSMLSMYLLLIFVLSFRTRGLLGKKSALEA